MTEEDELTARARGRVGAVLCGKYQLVALLGVGGMASVYAAKHLRNANRVAVKVLHPEIALDAGFRSRFLREGYAANSVEHPGTVRVLDDDRAEDGSVFLVMELLEGETLEARCERFGHALAAPEVVTIGRQLLLVLQAAHAKGIVHRDIKPENVFVTRDGVLKVLDFGVARLREGSPRRTRSGDVFGTPAFMPPEQALGRTSEVDALSDVWAVGATLFTLLSGRLVHEAETGQEMLVYAATRPARSLASVAPGAPPALVAVVDRALALRKEDRWPSALAMAQALETVQREALSAARVGPLAPDDEATDVAAPPWPTAGEHAAGGGSDEGTTIPTGAVAGGPTVAATPVSGGPTVGGVSAQSVGPRRTQPAVVAAILGVVAALGVGTLVLVGQRQSPPTSSSAAAPSRPPTAAAPAQPEAAPVPSAATPPSSEPAPSTTEQPPPTIAVSALPSAARRVPLARPAASKPPSAHDPLAP
ncbi:MAG TPA: protein kinase [Polyangiaceae bacterium]